MFIYCVFLSGSLYELYGRLAIDVLARSIRMPIDVEMVSSSHDIPGNQKTSDVHLRIFDKQIYI